MTDVAPGPVWRGKVTPDLNHAQRRKDTMAHFIKEAVDTLLDAITAERRRDIANACGGSLSILNKTKGRLRMIATAYQLDLDCPALHHDP